MRKEDFFEVLGDLDDGIVKGAETPVKRNVNWRAWGVVAACLALVCTLAVHFISVSNGDEVTSQGVADAAPMVYVNGTLYKQSGDQRSYPELRDEFVYLGQILSDATRDQGSSTDGVPKEDFQANHPVVGCEVYQYGQDIVLYINGAYWLYTKYEPGAY